MHLPQVDKYAEIKSFFSLWNPMVKIISLSFLILSLAFISNPRGAFLGLILGMSLVLLSRIPLGFVLAQLRWVFLFVGVFCGILLVTVPGERIYFLSLEGLRLGILIALRATSMCLVIFLITATMRFHTTLKALSQLGVSNKLIQLLFFTYRYIFIFAEETKRMCIAAYARLFRKKTNISTLKIVGNIVGMLFAHGFERTQRVYYAMSSRGYRGEIKTQDEFKLSLSDFLKAFLIILLAIALQLVR